MYANFEAHFEYAVASRLFAAFTLTRVSEDVAHY